ncbi:peptidase M50, partial [Mycobacterium sp. ITM-2017-0098]
FGRRRVPRVLRELPVLDFSRDPDIGDYRRLVVLGSHRDLAAVLTRLLRSDRLDVEVAHVRRSWQARGARTAPATRIPLVRDETG